MVILHMNKPSERRPPSDHQREQEAAVINDKSKSDKDSQTFAEELKNMGVEPTLPRKRRRE